MHLDSVSINPEGKPLVYHLEGQVVELKDQYAPVGRREYIRSSGGSLFTFDGRWRETRTQSLLRAAEELEQAASGLFTKAAELRLKAEETRAAPGPDSGFMASHGESAAGGRDVTPAGQDQCHLSR